MMNQVKKMVSKSKGEQWARCLLEDLTGEINLLVFPRAYAAGLQQQLKVGSVVVASGRLSFRSEGPEATAELIVDDIQPLEAAVSRYARELRLNCDPATLPDEKLEALREVLDASQGACRVVLAHETAEGMSLLELDQRVNVTQNLLESIDKILGTRSWQIKNAS